VYRESGGNPFYLEELARAAARPDRARALRHAAAEPEEARLAPPESVIASIRAEFATLPPRARTVLDAAAVAGEAFELELVARIADEPEPVALAALDQLLEADLVRPTDAPRRFHFRHPIVRRSVYEAMPTGWRLGAHERAAAALEAAHGPLAARAHHVERSAAAGDERAIAVLTEAARSVAGRAPRTAARWLTTALRLLPDDVGPEQRLPLRTEAAATLNHAGAPDEGLELLEQALPLVSPDRADERAQLIVQIAVAKRQTGHPLASRSLLEQALASLEDADSEEGRWLRVELTLGHYFGGEFTEMGERADAMLATAREQRDQPLASIAATLSSIAHSSCGRTATAATALGAAEAAFARLTDEQLAVYPESCGLIALAATRLEHIDEALRHTRRGLALARSTGRGSLIAGLLGLEAQGLLMQGRVSESVQVAETATDEAILSGNDQLLLWTLQTAATAAMWAGKLDQALFSAREAVAIAQRIGEGFFTPLARLGLAGALQASGDAAGARAELDGLDAEPVAALLDLSAGRGWELLVRTHLELGDIDAADDVATRAYARAAAAVHLDQQTATALCARSAVLLARGDGAAAAVTATDAAVRADRAGNALLAARARALSGRAAAAMGDRDRAIAQLDRAREGLMDCGAQREADTVARELRRLGRRVRRVVQAPPDAGLRLLSTREREVADHVAAGATNRGIAGVLVLSEKTIESHLARIYGKLGVRSRAALAALVERERARDAYELDI
jgi:ATP/maltotriose-dependent transcriptional regulator MalT